jgi:hypothetical protein
MLESEYVLHSNNCFYLIFVFWFQCGTSLLLTLFVSVNHHGLFLSTRDASKSKTFTDACIVYQAEGKVNYGIIENIFHVDSRGLSLLKIRSLQNARFDTLTFSSKRFVNENIIYGNFSTDGIHLVSVSSIIEKACLYQSKDVSYFARFPNLYESS